MSSNDIRVFNRVFSFWYQNRTFNVSRKSNINFYNMNNLKKRLTYEKNIKTSLSFPMWWKKLISTTNLHIIHVIAVVNETVSYTLLKLRKKSVPSPVTSSPSLKLFLGLKIFSSNRLNLSNSWKKGIIWLSLSLMFLNSSLSAVGGGNENASKPEK